MNSRKLIKGGNIKNLIWSRSYMNKEILLSNIDKVHTTELGIDRIKITINSYSYTINSTS